MTDIKSDDTTKAVTAPAVKPAPPAKSGRGLASFAVLIALGAAGGSAYLWYLWQQEQSAQAARLSAAIKQATAQYDAELKPLRELQTLKPAIDQTRTENRAATQDLKSQLLGLTGDFQPLKNAMELQKGENEVLKGELKLLRENRAVDKTEAQQHKQALDKQLREQQDSLASLDEQLKNLRLASNGLSEEISALKLAVAKGGDINAFPLAEVDYLLRLADSKLKLERNIPTARLALETAQQRLKAVDESALAPLQTMLDEALGSLRGVKLPDYSGLAHKIAIMETQVSALPIKINSAVPDIKNRIKPAADVTVSDDAERPWWDRTGEAVWNQFKEIVVVRRVRSEAPPLIGTEEEFFLRQNLRLTLESMRTALLRGDAQSYQDSLETVNTWLATHFDPQDAHVTAFLGELAALQAVQFNTYIPDLAGLNKTFQEIMARRHPIRSVSKPSAPNAEQPTTGGGVRP